MNDPRTLKFVFSIAKLANKYVLGKLTHTHKCWVKKKKKLRTRFKEKQFSIDRTHYHMVALSVYHRHVMQRTWYLLHSAALANAYDPVATKSYDSHPLSDL